MNWIKLFFCLTATLFFSVDLVAQSVPERPNPPVLVNDFASLFDDGERQSLASKLTNYNDSTSSQIVVVSIKSIGDYDAASYAFELAEKWGIGQKGKDNGILILIAVEERKTFIATGYGMEAYVPDAMANRIIEEVMRPNFRNGDFYQGVDQASDVIINLLSGTFDPMTESTGHRLPLLVFGVIFFIVIIIMLSRRGGGNNRGGGYFGQGTTLGNPYRRGSTWTDFSAGSGSFGSGSSGGGFGGFGGGSFGGGGAGGSW